MSDYLLIFSLLVVLMLMGISTSNPIHTKKLNQRLKRSPNPCTSAIFF